MASPLSPIDLKCVVEFYTPDSSEQAFNRAALPVAQKAINSLADGYVKPALPIERPISLQLRDSSKASTDSSLLTEDHDSDELYYTPRGSSNPFIIRLNNN